MGISVTFADILDQFRYVTGTYAAMLLFFCGAVPIRNYGKIRIFIGYLISLSGALVFLTLKAVLYQLSAWAWITLSVFYGMGQGILSILVMFFCFETSMGNILFRCLMAMTGEATVTTVVRYLIVMNCFPDLPTSHPIGYTLIMLGIYTVSYFALYRILAVSMQRRESEDYFSGRYATILYSGMCIGFMVIQSPVKLACEYIIEPLGKTEEYLGIYEFLRYFCTGIQFLISIGMFAILHHIFNIAVLQSERRILDQLLQEKEHQYEFSKENIETINRKCHDLKHQLKALEVANVSERKEMIREARKAVDFYDAVVKTGNEVLDTILTEKSMYCVNHNIRLSCTVNTKKLEKIRVIDLYTMLGNAIDNAIECVDALELDEKKVISLSVLERGQMICITVENYYEGNIQIQQGLPVTHKEDKANHGYGVRSIQSIVKKYSGYMQIDTQDHIFSLQLILPA